MQMWEFLSPSLYLFLQSELLSLLFYPSILSFSPECSSFHLTSLYLLTFSSFPYSISLIPSFIALSLIITKH